MKRITRMAALTAAIAAAGATAYAAPSAEMDALPIAPAKVSLTQAIAAAEQHAQGKATRADYEPSQTGWVYDVEVVKGQLVLAVKVDADQGKVLSSEVDRADQDDDRDPAD